MNSSELIEQYAAGGPRLAQAIAGLTPRQFAAVPIPDTWSIQQITLHVMDSDLIASDRMKRIIAEDNPPIIGYSESAFSQKLHYDKLDPFLAADIFQKNRQLTAVLLRNLAAADFARTGTHNQRGPISLADMLQSYVEHLEHHLKFLRQKRELVQSA